jgi:hypothetical protein
VPGPRGNLIRLTDAWRDNSRDYRKTPHPTYVPKEGEEYPDIQIMEAIALDPFETMFYHENVLNLRPYIEDPEEMIPPIEDRTAHAAATD